jgi:hypothetical protein
MKRVQVYAGRFDPEDGDDLNGPAGFLRLDWVRADELEPDAHIIPSEMQRYLEDDDAVIGAEDCPPCYRVTSVRRTGRRVFAETVLSHFSTHGEKRKTFLIDLNKELAVLPAVAFRSLRAEWAERLN